MKVRNISRLHEQVKAPLTFLTQCIKTSLFSLIWKLFYKIV